MSTINTSNRRLARLSVCIIVFSFLTTQQSYDDAMLMTISTLFFTFCYAIVRQTRLFHPKPGVLSPAEETEWRSRIIGILHAIIITIGSLHCFSEWRNMTHEESWSSANRVTSFWATIFGGFLQYDICWIIYHLDEYDDISALFHHILFLGATHYNVNNCYFARPYAWLSLAELSTPFLHLRWFFAVAGRKDEPMYFFNSYMFASTFLLTRVVGYTWGLWDVWWNGSEIWMKLPAGAYIVMASVHAGYGLNLFWGVKVLKALMRALGTKKED